MIFDSALWRFACSGTLLGLYGLLEWWLRRNGAGQDRPGVPPPGVLKVGILLALGSFYLLIRPAGGPLLAGWGNLVGILLAGVAMSLRVVARRRTLGVRHPATAARLVFYTALPIAVGVPWGLVALTLPAYTLWAYCTWREDVILSARLGAPYRDLMARTPRLIPGIW